MACGTGKTRVIQELVSNVSGRVLWIFLDIFDAGFESAIIFEFPSRSNTFKLIRLADQLIQNNIE